MIPQKLANGVGVLVQTQNIQYPIFTTVSFEGTNGITVDNQLGVSSNRITIGLTGFSGTSSGTNTGDQLIFKTLAVSGQSDIVADTTSDTLTVAAGNGITLTTNASTDTLTVTAAATGTNTGDQNLFSTLAVSGQSNVVADSTSDTLTLVAGSGMTITTDATTDTVTFASSGGGTGETQSQVMGMVSLRI